MDNHRFSDEWMLRAAMGIPGVTREVAERLRREGCRHLSDALIRSGLASERTLTKAIRDSYGIETIDLDQNLVERPALALVPERVCRQYQLLPVSCDEERIIVAMANPLDGVALSCVRAASGREPVPYYCRGERIDELIAEWHCADAFISQLLQRFNAPRPAIAIVEGAQVDGPGESRGPVGQLVDAIIAKAVEMRASDIHLEHEERSSGVRYRIDGVLRNIMRLPRLLAATALVTRIKLMANLNLSEHRLPQDGAAKLRVDGVAIGLRISVLPTSYGEKVVIRLLDSRVADVNFGRLGFKPDLAAKLEAALCVAQGMLLATGPTGSGKTTTLYSMLNRLKSEDLNIVTIEDPIEYKLEGINQVQVNERTGLSFAKVLRSVLRQDPDVILVGEIRDRETAEVAFQAALTGHLVMSTLHTNDTISTVTRLADLGLERFKIAPGLLAITAQRLVRRLCRHCRRQVPLPRRKPAAQELLRRHGLPAAYCEPVGCDLCRHSGYSGRLPLLELLEADAAVRQVIVACVDEAALRRAALASGALHVLAEDAACHLAEGEVSFEDLLPHLSANSLAAEAGLGRRRRILVVDDERDCRFLLRGLLEPQGYEVAEAQDGLEALGFVARDQPDLLLLDLGMPRLDGYAVLRQLRQSLGAVHLPVVVLTSRTGGESQREAFDNGADDYVLKPIDETMLLARIKAILRRQQLSAG